MTVAEFEEKEIEGPLNVALSCGVFPWTPGQVLEQVVGIDAAIHTTIATFWAAHGYSTPPSGAVVAPLWWPSPLAIVFIDKPPPPFLYNVFLQYKRPELLSHGGAKEWSDWGTPYYRFWITDHQQLALDACAQAVGSNGLVAYASPAFHTRAELFGHIEKQTLIESTHFAPAIELSNHARYTYVDAHTKGIAHSEPTEVEPLRFTSDGAGGDGPPDEPFRGGGDGRGPADLLADAANAATAAVAASPSIVGSAEIFAASVDRAITMVEDWGHDASAAVRNFVQARIFSMSAGLTWAVAGREAKPRRPRRT